MFFNRSGCETPFRYSQISGPVRKIHQFPILLFTQAMGDEVQ